MAKQIQGPDGQIHDVPDDATEEEIAEIMAAAYPATITPVPSHDSATNEGTLAALSGMLREMSDGAAAATHPEITQELGLRVPTSTAARLGAAPAEFIRGFGAGGAHLIYGGGDLVRRGLGMERIIDDPEIQAAMQAPEGVAGAAGSYTPELALSLLSGLIGERATVWGLGRAAPYLARTPRAVETTVRLGASPVVQGATGAAIDAVRGRDPKTGMLISAAGPVAGQAVSGTMRAIGTRARPWARSALKIPASVINRQAGRSRAGSDVIANRIVDFVVDNRLMSPDAARRLIAETEAEVDLILASHPTTLADAPQRAQQYLSALRRRIGRQGLPADDLAVIDDAIRGFEAVSPLTETVTTMVPTTTTTPSRLTLPNGQPAPPTVTTTMQPVTSRQLRTDVDAREALGIGRETSARRTGRAYGEMKGARMEADKAVERATRDAAKTAVPALRAPLRREGMAIQARDVLELMESRMANRDPYDAADAVAGAVAAANGSLPWHAWLRRGFRNSQLPAAIGAEYLGAGGRAIRTPLSRATEIEQALERLLTSGIRMSRSGSE